MTAAHPATNGDGGPLLVDRQGDPPLHQIVAQAVVPWHRPTEGGRGSEGFESVVPVLDRVPVIEVVPLQHGAGVDLGIEVPKPAGNRLRQQGNGHPPTH